MCMETKYLIAFPIWARVSAQLGAVDALGLRFASRAHQSEIVGVRP